MSGRWKREIWHPFRCPWIKTGWQKSAVISEVFLGDLLWATAYMAPQVWLSGVHFFYVSYKVTCILGLGWIMNTMAIFSSLHVFIMFYITECLTKNYLVLVSLVLRISKSNVCIDCLKFTACRLYCSDINCMMVCVVWFICTVMTLQLSEKSSNTRHPKHREWCV